MAKIKKNHGIWETECGICKKKFCLEPEFWAYKIKHRSSIKSYYCSYSCMQAAKAEIEKRKREKKVNSEKQMELLNQKRQRIYQDKIEFGKIIGANIMACMDEKGQTFKSLAEETGISHTVIRNYANGKTVASALYICKIALALGVTTDRLLTMED